MEDDRESQKRAADGGADLFGKESIDYRLEALLGLFSPTVLSSLLLPDINHHSRMSPYAGQSFVAMGDQGEGGRKERKGTQRETGSRGGRKRAWRHQVVFQVNVRGGFLPEAFLLYCSMELIASLCSLMNQIT